MFVINKRKIIIGSCVAIILFLAGIGLLFWQKGPQDINNISDKEIISYLQKNADAKEYMDLYKDFRIDKKAVLDKDSIIKGQNAKSFKEVYQDLELENNRYVKIDLINPAGDRGMVCVLDFKEKKIINAFGLIMLKAGIGA